ncbi:MAG: DUF1028 domain-containing protein [Candidatus Eisenbacteria bacterium]|nr:DUF1028 domain-containing protein [Candidatus Eisenbacteria bacterium]
MTRTIAAALLGSLCLSPSAAFSAKPIATFSIVAWDSTTGDLGVAVQSKFFAVGAVVPWARAGVGAVATQSFGNTTFGPRGLEMLAAGRSPGETMEALLSDDAGRAQRQVGIVDAAGRAASFTGEGCMAWAGGKEGVHYAAQGNILAGPEVVAAMSRAFESTGGLLGDRLLAALDAGQAAGGDSRGMQSAALLVVRDKGGYGGFNDRWCDLRVDDAPNPFVELRRLYNLWKPNALIQEGYKACEAAQWDKAFGFGREALVLDSSSGDPQYHLGCYYSKAGRGAEALVWLAEAVALDSGHGKTAAGDSDYAPLRDNPEFKKLTGTGD